jgi:predicted CXXCH cytochrome family protein
MSTKGASKVKGLLAAIGGAVLVMSAFAPAALGQITNSKHNLSSGSSATSKFDGTAEICVFCHTPHGANTNVAAPLWNKTAPAGPYTTYSTGNSYSIDGDVAAVGSVSLACLSCHDGSLAIATMINAPGSGGYNAAGAILAGTWTSTNNGVDTTTGKMGTNVTNLGTNLVNDHPVGIGYCGASTAPSAGTLTCGDADFAAPTSAVVGGNRVWWIDTGTAGRQKTDLSLYTRGATGTDSIPRVECASCHDPHSTTNPTFLRVSNNASAVCLTCHQK